MTRTEHQPLCFATEPARGGSRKIITVTVVNKSKAGRLGLAALIGNTAGFACVGAHALVRNALEKASMERPEVVVVDLAQVESGPINGIRLFRDRFPKTESLALVPSPEPRPVTALLEAGAAGCLVKPVCPVELLRAITEVHQCGACLSGEVARLLIGGVRKRVAARRSLEHLTRREREVLECLVLGLPSKEIARKCSISLQTVNSHLAHIYDKFGVHSRAAVVARFLAP
jgi:DNA-binding NarL/FixJ family response regulator